MLVEDDTVREAARNWVEAHAEQGYWGKVLERLSNKMLRNYRAAEETGWKIQAGHDCGVNKSKRWTEHLIEMFLKLHDPPDSDQDSVPTFSLILEVDESCVRVHRDLMGASGTVRMLTREMMRSNRMLGESRIPAEVCTDLAVVWSFVLFNYTRVLFDGTDLARLRAVLGSGKMTPEQPNLPFDIWELYRLAEFMGCTPLIEVLQSRECIDVWGNTGKRSQVLNQLNYILVRAEAFGSRPAVSPLMRTVMDVAVARTGSLYLLLRTPLHFSKDTWEHWLSLGVPKEGGGDKARACVGLWSPIAYMFYARQFVDQDKVHAYLFDRLREVSGMQFSGFGASFRRTLYFEQEKLHDPFCNAPTINTYEGEYGWCTPVRCYKNADVYGGALLAFQLSQLGAVTPLDAPGWFIAMKKGNLDALVEGKQLTDSAVTTAQTNWLTSPDNVEADFYSYELRACMAEKRGPSPVNGKIVMDSSLVHAMSLAVRRAILAQSLRLNLGKRKRR